ncbi:MAG TPA: hypothetical protein DEH25_03755 [Chloroflexi bacterium]|nr:hypothetical protein [Chloroflexota bacterium]
MKTKQNLLNKFNPCVPIIWLYISAGLVWLGVGVMLDAFASRWLQLAGFPSELLLLVAGLALATAIYLFGFSKLARKNIRRIGEYATEKVCLFAFQSWTSYPLVAFMMGLGIYLRHYSTFPKPLLAILYLGIGSALFAAGLLYFVHIVQARRPQKARISSK